ncbi:MAG: endonuclease III [Candidatus Woesearchaeota archaeon]
MRVNHSERDRAIRVVRILKREYGIPGTALRFSNPFQLLIATMLSAQCTDARVNAVTPVLFKRFRTPEDFARADVKELEGIIRSTGFYHLKARRIVEASRAIVERFNSRVPASMDDLLSLPGVARKTANLVLSEGFGVVKGIVVDTHVRRLSFRLGFTRSRDPRVIEQDLMTLLPRREWRNISFLLISHGRMVCNALKPKCELCILKRLCPRRGV